MIVALGTCKSYESRDETKIETGRKHEIVASYQLPIGFPTFKAVGKSVRGFLFCITMPDWLPPKSNAMHLATHASLE